MSYIFTIHFPTIFVLAFGEHHWIDTYWVGESRNSTALGLELYVPKTSFEILSFSPHLQNHGTDGERTSRIENMNNLCIANCSNQSIGSNTSWNQHTCTVDGRNPAPIGNASNPASIFYNGVKLPSPTGEHRISEPSTVAPDNWELEVGSHFTSLLGIFKGKLQAIIQELFET